MRRGELRALRWSDVDLQKRVIHRARGWDDVEGEQDVKSDAGERDVPILDALAPELAAHQLRTGRCGNALVFGLDAEMSFYPSTIRNRALAAWGWKEAPNPSSGPGKTKTVLVKAREDGLDPIGLHEARHTCASVLIASGANPKVIQKIMGHATIQMTFDQYGHLMPGGLEEAAAAANSYLARMSAT
jgi:integrase